VVVLTGAYTSVQKAVTWRTDDRITLVEGLTTILSMAEKADAMGAFPVHSYISFHLTEVRFLLCNYTLVGRTWQIFQNLKFYQMSNNIWETICLIIEILRNEIFNH